MILFEDCNKKKFAFIHIPKTCGSYIKTLIRKQFVVSKEFLHLSKNFDLAHIPLSLTHQYIERQKEYHFFSFLRNPYDRVISSYFYKNKNKTVSCLKQFIKERISLIDFNDFTDYKNIHYFPQTKFVDNSIDLINLNQVQTDTTCGPANIMMNNFKLKTYSLEDYLDNRCIEIINNIYELDFNLTNTTPL